MELIGVGMPLPGDPTGGPLGELEALLLLLELPPDTVLIGDVDGGDQRCRLPVHLDVG